MKISVIGYGNVGAQLAQLWQKAGHTVTVGLRPDSSRRAEAAGLGFEVLDPTAAMRAADVVVIALPWTAVEPAIKAGSAALDGKIVLDATNPARPDLSIIIPEAGSGGQRIAALAPGAKVVKAFNTIGAKLMGSSAFDMMYCSDEEEAKKIAHQLIADTSMSPVDVGPLKNAVYLEQLAGLWIDLAMKGRVQLPFGFNVIRPAS